MARRRRSKKGNMGCAVVAVIIGVAATVWSVAVYSITYISDNIDVFIWPLLLIGAGVITYAVRKSIIKKQREELLSDILESLNLNSIDSILKPYDDQIIVKSRQALDNYDDIKYLKENDRFGEVIYVTRMKDSIKRSIISFLQANQFSHR